MTPTPRVSERLVSPAEGVRGTLGIGHSRSSRTGIRGPAARSHGARTHHSGCPQLRNGAMDDHVDKHHGRDPTKRQRLRQLDLPVSWPRE